VAREKFVAAADHTIDTYRNNDAQTVYEAEWQRAHTMLLHALSTEPDDKPVHGKLRLCEGHVSRIEGYAHHSVAELNDAVQEFQEAQQLLPQSPDPALGLARVYLSLKPADVDKAGRGVQSGGKERLPHGRNREAVATGGRVSRSRQPDVARRRSAVRGLPQEKEQIQQRRRRLSTRAWICTRRAPGGGTPTAAD
jgi:hypothetical protein